MPIDRNTTNTSRPLKPTLATNRTAKTPIAPRLAPSATSTPTGSTQTSRTSRSNVGSTPRLSASAREDVTPVKAFIGSNVTPRSSARKSRVGVSSAQSTPSDTPSGTLIASRPTSTVGVPQKEQGHGHGGLEPSAQKRPRSVVGGNNYNTTPTPRAPLSNIYNHAPARGARDASPMFFHADTARTAQEQPPPQKKAPVFFFANGEQDANPSTSDVSSPPLSSVGKAQPDSKFFHVDSITEARCDPLILTPPPLSASPEWSDFHTAQGQHVLRPPSPSKEHMHLSYRKGVSQVLRPNLQSRNSALSIFSGPHANNAPAEQSKRRFSAASSAVRFGHAKSASLSSIDSNHSLKKAPTLDIPAITPSPLHNENRVSSNGSIPESVASAPPESTEALSGLSSPQMLGSTKPGQSVLEHMNKLAANARRERKVLDLEISNNSLLAINRSLEKEMRKQKAELRRFRRMSRAGRFSTETPTSNLEEFSAIGVSELGDLSDMSEEEELEEEPEDSSDSSIDESTMDPSLLEERDAARRSRDEKRLQLDLSKHRELLIDSQKMNQSLKRCMTWTEELIKDGQKALAYNVRASDVQLGGRVLSSEERAEGEENEESKTLLSPWSPPHRATDPFDLLPTSSPERPERDSGVDLDVMLPILPHVPAFISPLGSPLTETPSRPPFTRGSQMS